MDDGEAEQVGVDDVDGGEARNETRSFAREDQLDAVLIEVALLCVVVIRPCEPRPLRGGADITAHWGGPDSPTK